MDMAARAYKANRKGLALLFAENSLALNRVSGGSRDERTDRADRIRNLTRRAGDSLTQTKRECLLCEGSGKRELARKGLRREGKKEEVRLVKSNLDCKSCSGRGYVWGKSSMADKVEAQGRAKARYIEIQNSRGFMPVGLVWIPEGWEDQLSLRETVALKRAISSPCKTCSGVGRDDCRKCDSAGYVKCDAKNCENGMVVVPRSSNFEDGLKGTSLSHRKECKICRGSARRDCKECRAKGSLLCKKCNGSGLPERCDKCQTSGLVECSRCDGSGVYKDEDCQTCEAGGKTMCSTYKGSGRRD